MNYLSEMLKLPVVDAAGEKIGIVNDLALPRARSSPVSRRSHSRARAKRPS